MILEAFKEGIKNGVEVFLATGDSRIGHMYENLYRFTKLERMETQGETEIFMYFLDVRSPNFKSLFEQLEQVSRTLDENTSFYQSN